MLITIYISNYIYITDRKYIEQPIKPAPPPIITTRQYNSTPYNTEQTANTNSNLNSNDKVS